MAIIDFFTNFVFSVCVFAFIFFLAAASIAGIFRVAVDKK